MNKPTLEHIFRLNLLTHDNREILKCPASEIRYNVVILVALSLDDICRSVSFPRVSSKLYAVGGGEGVQLWSERGDLLLQLGDPAPGALANTVTLSMDGRYIIRSGAAGILTT